VDSRIGGHGEPAILLERETWRARCGQSYSSPAGLAVFPQSRKGAAVKLNKTARTLIGITALAWSIPFAQVAASQQLGLVQPQANSAEFVTLDADGTDEKDERSGKDGLAIGE
jgi:hypothetical protein